MGKAAHKARASLEEADKKVKDRSQEIEKEISAHAVLGRCGLRGNNSSRAAARTYGECSRRKT